jgi:predicted  nucleic acid-binding Zn-ribbon protein
MTSNWPQSNAMTYSSSSAEQLSDSNESVKYQQIIDELKNENTHLKDEVNNFKKTEKDYDEQIHTLQLRIEELEDWNGDTFEVQNKVKIILLIVL